MKTIRMCQTRYFGPTNTKGSRVQATHITTRRRVTVPWDHALDRLDNHIAAATKLFGATPDVCARVDGGGYIFGADPSSEVSS
jgi:predicted RNA binding protein YcfA (HicA-like mRNA interferase family)